MEIQRSQSSFESNNQPCQTGMVVNSQLCGSSDVPIGRHNVQPSHKHLSASIRKRLKGADESERTGVTMKSAMVSNRPSPLESSGPFRLLPASDESLELTLFASGERVNQGLH